MMKQGTPAYSNFDIAAYLAEVILLGCVALRVGVSKRVEWDGPGMRSTNLRPPPSSSNATTGPVGKRNRRCIWLPPRSALWGAAALL